MPLVAAVAIPVPTTITTRPPTLLALPAFRARRRKLMTEWARYWPALDIMSDGPPGHQRAAGVEVRTVLVAIYILETR